MLRETILGLGLVGIAYSWAPPYSNTSCSGNTGLPSAAALKNAVNTPTDNTLCPAGTKYFPQPIHHDTFNGNWYNPDEIYLQQYEVIDKYYKPGGPIFLYQTPEAPLSCVEDMTSLAWAQELGGLAISLEHRYFGLSCPYGLNYSEAGTWQFEQMDSLTMDNVLLDGVSFINWLKTEAYPTAMDSKVIMIGGSYGGDLAALYRVHYPEVIYGSLASAPVTRGLITDPNDPLAYAYGDWTSMVYNDLSAEVAAKIRRSVDDIKGRIAAGNFDGIQKALNICNDVNSTELADWFVPMMGMAYGSCTQFNYAMTNYTLQTVINQTLALNDSLDILAVATHQYAMAADTPGACMTLGPPDYTRNPFDYVMCTYLPYPRQDHWREDSIIGSFPVNTSVSNMNDVRCNAIWGIDAIDGGDMYQRSVGLDPFTLESTTRLIISQGLFDPVTGLGPLAWAPTADRNHSRVLYMAQTAHGGELQAATPMDFDATVQARVYILNSIKEWLGMV